MRRIWLVIVATVCALVAVTAAGAVATPPFTTVMTGLDNPRGLTFGPDGALYVAEAGRGGTQPCFPDPEGGPGQFAGLTGAISRLRHGVQERVVSGLPSVAGEGGVAATGPHDIAMLSRNAGRVTIGLGADPANRAHQCGSLGPLFGWVARVSTSGSWGLESDLAAYEAAANPDQGIRDSNPYGLLTEHRLTLATDAGGNSLLAIQNGSITTLATFPSRPQGRSTDSVPTTVVRGPDGAYYVGELTGAPFVPGAANVYRVVPGQAPTVYRAHFSFIIDIAFGSDGSLYVLQFANGPDLSGPGELWRVAPNGTRTLVATGLVAPGGVAIGPDGAFYISNCSIFPGSGPFPCNGQVVRIPG